MNVSAANTPRLNDARAISDNVFILLFVSIVIFVINGLVIHTYCKSNGEQCVTNKVYIFLAMADGTCGLVLGLTSVTRRVLVAIDETGYNTIICTLSYGSIYCLTAISELCLAFANVERYFAIIKQPLYNRFITKRNVNVITLIVWSLPVLILFVTVVQNSLEILEEPRSCQFEHTIPSWMHISFSFTMMIFMVFSLFLDINILIQASKMNKSINLNPEDTTESRVRNQNIRHSIRKGKMIGFLTITLMICWLPFCITSLIIGFGLAALPEIFKLASFFLALFSRIINPSVYAYQRQDLREAAIKMFCRCRRTAVVPSIPQVATNPNPYDDESTTNIPNEESNDGNNDIEIDILEGHKNLMVQDQSIPSQRDIYQ